MPTNKEWLFSLPLDEQLAWMNAEHVEGVEIHGEVCEFEHEHVQKLDELDSREKLEADVREWVDDIGWLSDKETQVADFIAWLDRQAAITERELCKKCEWPSLAAMPDIEKQAENERLQAEVDRLKRENLNLAHDFGECIAERDAAISAKLHIMRERDTYRNLFGKSLDYADAIVELGVDIDEGLA